MTKIKLLPCLCAMLTMVSAAFGEPDQQPLVSQGEAPQEQPVDIVALEKARMELAEKLFELGQKHPEWPKVELHYHGEILIGKDRSMPTQAWDKMKRKHPEMSDDEIYNNWAGNPNMLHSGAITSQARVQ